MSLKFSSDQVDACLDSQIIMFAKNTTFAPVVGFSNISEVKQMTGIIATLNIVRRKAITTKVLASLQNSCRPTASIITNSTTVVMFVKTSQHIDAIQNRLKLIPLTYCRNLARHAFSCNGKTVNRSCKK